jgi:hypothetical protein
VEEEVLVEAAAEAAAEEVVDLVVEEVVEDGKYHLILSMVFEGMKETHSYT